MNFESIKELIQSQLTINQVIGFYLLGKNNIRGDHKYACPFHNEKTPSLSASDSKNIFKCFGCGEFGDIISFVMKYKNLSYIEALEEISEEFGIDIDVGDLKKHDASYAKRELIYEFHNEINVKMVASLQKHKEQLHYLRDKRGLTEETITEFGIGFSYQREIEEFAKELQKTEKYKEVSLKDTGLFSYKEDTKKSYFLFSNRIMYPIRNNRGKIVGWSGGRIYPDQEPKYINSINNFIYNKSHILFNFDKANFYESDTLIICEGNMDSTQIYNFGGKNAVSLLGTNLTEEQLQLFQNKVSKVVLALDNDSAGGKAVFKISKMLLSAGIIPYIVSYGREYKDIDDFLKGNKEQYFGNVDEFFKKEKKEVLGEYMIEGYLKNREKMSLEKRYEILSYIKDMFASIEDDVLRNVYKEELQKHDIVFENLEKEWQEKKETEKKIQEENVVNPEKFDNNTILLAIIYSLLRGQIQDEELLLLNPGLHSVVQQSDTYRNGLDAFEKDHEHLLLDFEYLTKSFLIKKIEAF